MKINTNGMRWSILIISICALLKAVYNMVMDVNETVFNQSVIAIILILLVIAVVITEIIERKQTTKD